MTLSATKSKLIVYQGNTQALQITGLQDALSGDFLNAATIVATLVNQNGTPQTGFEEITFTYTPASNGDYVGIYGDRDFLPDIGSNYTIIIDGDQNGSDIHLELPAEVRARRT